MSVEEMKIMRIIGPKYFLNRVLHRVILQGSMHMIDALTMVNSADFFLPLALTEKNIEIMEEKPFLKPYSSSKDFTEDERILKQLYDLFDLKTDFKMEFLAEEYDYNSFMKQFSDIYKIAHSTVNEIDTILQEIKKNKEYLENLKYLAGFNFDISFFNNMTYLVFRLVRISIENYDKLKQNYDNIPAIILKVAVEGKEVILLTATIETLEENLEKILSSVNYTSLSLPAEMKGTVEEVLTQLTEEIEEKQASIESLKGSLESYKERYGVELKKMFSRLEMEKKIETLKSKIAMGKKLFFMFGFVPASAVKKLNEELEKETIPGLTILTDGIKKTYRGTTPPTKLINIKLFSPFESLVKMYGTPSYREKDPTLFFGLTYMLIFGAMFGDVGQGLVLLLSGIFIKYFYQKRDFGEILSRLGLSSMFFGFLYGSVFGSEEILPALIMRPMANINNLLVSAVVFGVILICISYTYGIFNAIKEKNFKEGLLGENGLAGFLFYLLLLYTVFQIFILKEHLFPLIIVVLIILPFIILFKQPLAHLLLPADKSYKKLSANEFIEGSFGIIEMLLSMLSNTISFLRVGAFALNHVGLYIAFLTLANMMKTSWGNWAVLVVGNIVILSLEGLIVFIQALRLEYYELFSKYYRGNGVEYSPEKIS